LTRPTPGQPTMAPVTATVTRAGNTGFVGYVGYVG
jgi:hypothetical protein